MNAYRNVLMTMLYHIKVMFAAMNAYMFCKKVIKNNA